MNGADKWARPAWDDGIGMWTDADGVSHHTLADFVAHRLGICGCAADNGEAMGAVRILLEAAGRDYPNGKLPMVGDCHGWRAVEVLLGNEPVHAAFLALAGAVLDNAALVEHGSSWRGSWLTEDGRRVLEMLRSAEPMGTR